MRLSNPQPSTARTRWALTARVPLSAIHVEAALLMQERQVVGLGVDRLSLDHGPSTEYPTHYAWLPTNRWAVEGLATLALVPPVGATIVVGGPKVKGATGGPSRTVALF
jgi:kynurenine formamidase